ncbi:MAG: hypothetical protein WCN98_17210, partial [Verrucomicrobiaceae bacterium]
MNRQNSFAPVIIVLFGTFAGLFVVLSVLLGGGNTLAHLCYYILLGGGVLGLMAPRSAFYVWIFMCGYSDLLKRLMVVFGDVSQTDLYYVLGITPVMFSAIVFSLILGSFTGAYVVGMNLWFRLVAGLFFMVGTAAIYAAGAGGSMKTGIQGVANGGLYSLLLFVLPVLFPQPGQILRVLRFTAWVFVPVAIYGIVQQVQGFQPFEIAYLRTGLSIEIKQLFVERVRAFSTLNSPTALGAISSALLVICWFLARQPQPAPNQSRRWLGRVSAPLLMVAYAGSLIASTSRSAPLIIFLGLTAGWSFLKPGRTRAFYGVALGGFAALIIASPWLLSHLEEANMWITSDAGQGLLHGENLSILTYSDRLFGFANVLRNPAAYSLFGRWNGDYGVLPAELHHHDLLSSALLRFGIIPLMLSVIVISRIMRKLHRKLYTVADEGTSRLMAMSIGLASGIVFLSALSGNVLGCFPVNVFF